MAFLVSKKIMSVTNIILVLVYIFDKAVSSPTPDHNELIKVSVPAKVLYNNSLILTLHKNIFRNLLHPLFLPATLNTLTGEKLYNSTRRVLLNMEIKDLKTGEMSPKISKKNIIKKIFPMLLTKLEENKVDFKNINDIKYKIKDDSTTLNINEEVTEVDEEHDLDTFDTSLNSKLDIDYLVRSLPSSNMSTFIILPTDDNAETIVVFHELRRQETYTGTKQKVEHQEEQEEEEQATEEGGDSEQIEEQQEEEQEEGITIEGEQQEEETENRRLEDEDEQGEEEQEVTEQKQRKQGEEEQEENVQEEAEKEEEIQEEEEQDDGEQEDEDQEEGEQEEVEQEEGVQEEEEQDENVQEEAEKEEEIQEEEEQEEGEQEEEEQEEEEQEEGEQEEGEQEEEVQEEEVQKEEVQEEGEKEEGEQEEEMQEEGEQEEREQKEEEQEEREQEEGEQEKGEQEEEVQEKEEQEEGEQEDGEQEEGEQEEGEQKEGEQEEGEQEEGEQEEGEQEDEEQEEGEKEEGLQEGREQEKEILEEEEQEEGEQKEGKDGKYVAQKNYNEIETKTIEKEQLSVENLEEKRVLEIEQIISDVLDIESYTNEIAEVKNILMSENERTDAEIPSISLNEDQAADSIDIKNIQASEVTEEKSEDLRNPNDRKHIRALSREDMEKYMSVDSDIILDISGQHMKALNSLKNIKNVNENFDQKMVRTYTPTKSRCPKDHRLDFGGKCFPILSRQKHDSSIAEIIKLAPVATVLQRFSPSHHKNGHYYLKKNVKRYKNGMNYRNISINQRHENLFAEIDEPSLEFAQLSKPRESKESVEASDELVSNFRFENDDSSSQIYFLDNEPKITFHGINYPTKFGSPTEINYDSSSSEKKLYRIDLLSHIKKPHRKGKSNNSDESTEFSKETKTISDNLYPPLDFDWSGLIDEVLSNNDQNQLGSYGFDVEDIKEKNEETKLKYSSSFSRSNEQPDSEELIQLPVSTNALADVPSPILTSQSFEESSLETAINSRKSQSFNSVHLPLNPLQIDTTKSTENLIFLSPSAAQSTIGIPLPIFTSQLRNLTMNGHGLSIFVNGNSLNSQLTTGVQLPIFSSPNDDGRTSESTLSVNDRIRNFNQQPRIGVQLPTQTIRNNIISSSPTSQFRNQHSSVGIPLLPLPTQFSVRTLPERKFGTASGNQVFIQESSVEDQISSLDKLIDDQASLEILAPTNSRAPISNEQHAVGVPLPIQTSQSIDRSSSEIVFANSDFSNSLMPIRPASIGVTLPLSDSNDQNMLSAPRVRQNENFPIKIDTSSEESSSFRSDGPNVTPTKQMSIETTYDENILPGLAIIHPKTNFRYTNGRTVISEASMQTDSNEDSSHSSEEIRHISNTVSKFPPLFRNPERTNSILVNKFRQSESDLFKYQLNAGRIHYFSSKPSPYMRDSKSNEDSDEVNGESNENNYENLSLERIYSTNPYLSQTLLIPNSKHHSGIYIPNTKQVSSSYGPPKSKMSKESMTYGRHHLFISSESKEIKAEPRKLSLTYGPPKMSSTSMSEETLYHPKETFYHPRSSYQGTSSSYTSIKRHHNPPPLRRRAPHHRIKYPSKFRVPHSRRQFHNSKNNMNRWVQSYTPRRSKYTPRINRRYDTRQHSHSKFHDKRSSKNAKSQSLWEWANE